MSNDEFAQFIQAAQWQYAKTMPTIPHTYTTRGWNDEALFEAAVQFIRDHGKVKPWGKYRHTYFELNGFQYWSMGAPVAETTIINCEKLEPATYDDIAPVYDGIFDNDDARVEERKVYSLISDHLGGSVLDVGCGTGLLLDLHTGPLPGYLGLDPSKAMLERLKAKHPMYAGQVLRNKFEFARLGKYDLVVSLFGSMNYVAPPTLLKVHDLLAEGGKYFLMFYGPGYRPKTYQESGYCVKHFNLSKKKLEELFAGRSAGAVDSMGDYLIATNL